MKHAIKTGLVVCAVALCSTVYADNEFRIGKNKINPSVELSPGAVGEVKPKFEVSFSTWKRNTSYGQNRNSDGSEALAHDGDASTFTQPWITYMTGSTIQAFYSITPAYTGDIRVTWAHRTTDGYGNRGDFRVACLTEAGQLSEYLHYNTSQWTNSSYTPQVSSATVTDCHQIWVYARDIGKGAVAFTVGEIELLSTP